MAGFERKTTASWWMVPALGLVCALGAGTARAQDAPAPQQGSQQPANQRCIGVNEDGKPICVSAKPAPADAAQGDKSKTSTEKFPFPEEDAVPAASQGSNGKGRDGAAAGKPAADRFPFPGEGGDGKGAPLKDAGSSGESSSGSSSSSSSSSSSNAGDLHELPNSDDPSPLAGNDNLPKPTRSLVRKQPKPLVAKTDQEREAEDVKVGQFYASDGNYRAAYERAKDAVSIDATDAEAYLLLGDAARKLGRLDEAQVNYKKCLELDPVPKQRKLAEQALKSMTGGGA